MRLRCNYRHVDCHHGIVFIEDCNGKVSVTNDAEAVYYGFQQVSPGIRVVYKGTDDVWMEIIEANTAMGKCIDFKEWKGLTWDLLKRENV